MAKKIEVIKDIGFLELLHNSARFKKLSDGWFRDHFLSRLYGKDFNWSPASLEEHITWQEAELYAKGYGVQPSDFELSTLIDRSKYNPATIDAAKILGLKTDDYYWSRTLFAGDSVDAWRVHFKYGYVSDYGTDGIGYVRPVRFDQ